MDLRIKDEKKRNVVMRALTRYAEHLREITEDCEQSSTEFLVARDELLVTEALIRKLGEKDVGESLV